MQPAWGCTTSTIFFKTWAVVEGHQNREKKFFLQVQMEQFGNKTYTNKNESSFKAWLQWKLTQTTVHKVKSATAIHE